MSTPADQPAPPAQPPQPDGLPLGGHTIAAAAERVLRRELPAWSAPADLGTVVSWDAVADLDALSTAELPAGVIAVPGLSDAPARTADGYSGTLRLGVGVYCRGDGYTSTYNTAATWAALVRTVILRHLLRELGGLATAVTWLGEDLAASRVATSPITARTLGGAAVTFDVAVPDLAPFGLQPPTSAGPAPGDPQVRRVATSTRLVMPGQSAADAVDATGPEQAAQDAAAT